MQRNCHNLPSRDNNNHQKKRPNIDLSSTCRTDSLVEQLPRTRGQNTRPNFLRSVERCVNGERRDSTVWSVRIFTWESLLVKPRGAAPKALLAQQEGSHLFEEEGLVNFNAILNVPGRYMARFIRRRRRQTKRFDFECRKGCLLLCGSNRTPQ